MGREFRRGPWMLEYTAEDGARIDRLRYEGIELLTRAPVSFRPPRTDHGEYENRPVYGYDDCFPSVDVCSYPGENWRIPDHGELCWLSWRAEERGDRLIFSVKSRALPVLFEREMFFSSDGLRWLFRVINEGDKTLPFQHVMHPLMPLDAVIDIDLPPFEVAYDDINAENLPLKAPEEVSAFLLQQPKGRTTMLFLQKVTRGSMKLTFKGGFQLTMVFPEKLFPSVGIWWNNTAYPDEEGIRRNECAFEPTPGPTSVLTRAYEEGSCLNAAPGERCTWHVDWKMRAV